jgi:hypothetical protein
MVELVLLMSSFNELYDSPFPTAHATRRACRSFRPMHLLAGLLSAAVVGTQLVSLDSLPRRAEGGPVHADTARGTAARGPGADLGSDSAAARRRAARLARPYLNEVLRQRDSVVERWPERVTNPIRVWVAPSPKQLSGWDPAFPASVRSAFEGWQGSGVPVRFTFVGDSARAEVRVRWVSRFKTDESGRTVWWSNTRSWITKADITLATHASDGATQDAESLRAVALHEVGHLLGLDHCADSGNVMAAWVEVADLSDADRATARALYSLPAGRVR